MWKELPSNHHFINLQIFQNTTQGYPVFRRILQHMFMDFKMEGNRKYQERKISTLGQGI